MRLPLPYSSPPDPASAGFSFAPGCLLRKIWQESRRRLRFRPRVTLERRQARHFDRDAPAAFGLTSPGPKGLEAAAKADGRSVSNLIERILRSWLQDHGFMKPDETGKQER